MTHFIEALTVMEDCRVNIARTRCSTHLDDIWMPGWVIQCGDMRWTGRNLPNRHILPNVLSPFLQSLFRGSIKEAGFNAPSPRRVPDTWPQSHSTFGW
jgi:hypothetical protein